MKTRIKLTVHKFRIHRNIENSTQNFLFQLSSRVLVWVPFLIYATDYRKKIAKKKHPPSVPRRSRPFHRPSLGFPYALSNFQARSLASFFFPYSSPLPSCPLLTAHTHTRGEASQKSRGLPGPPFFYSWTTN